MAEPEEPAKPSAIHEIYVFIGVNADGSEGIVCRGYPGSPDPAFCDRAGLESLREQIRVVVDRTGIPVRVVRFASREDLEWIRPQGPTAAELLAALQKKGPEEPGTP